MSDDQQPALSPFAVKPLSVVQSRPSWFPFGLVTSLCPLIYIFTSPLQWPPVISNRACMKLTSYAVSHSDSMVHTHLLYVSSNNSAFLVISAQLFRLFPVLHHCFIFFFSFPVFHISMLQLLNCSKNLLDP